MGTDWPLTPDSDGNWQCRRCSRLRWWVREHRRGQGAMGVVYHTYSVTTGEAVA